MPWMKAEAQFPTPINATLTLGICGTLLGFSICNCIIKSYAALKHDQAFSVPRLVFFLQLDKKRLLNDAD